MSHFNEPSNYFTAFAILKFKIIITKKFQKLNLKIRFVALRLTLADESDSSKTFPTPPEFWKESKVTEMQKFCNSLEFEKESEMTKVSKF